MTIKLNKTDTLGAVIRLTMIITVMIIGWSGTAWGQGGGTETFTGSTTESVVFKPPTTTTTTINLT